MTKDRGDQLALGYRIGLPVAELAQAYEVSPEVVLREVQERGIKLRAEDRKAA